MINLNTQIKAAESGHREVCYTNPVWNLFFELITRQFELGHVNDRHLSIYSNSGSAGQGEMEIHNPSHSAWKSRSHEYVPVLPYDIRLTAGLQLKLHLY